MCAQAAASLKQAAASLKQVLISIKSVYVCAVSLCHVIHLRMLSAGFLYSGQPEHVPVQLYIPCLNLNQILCYSWNGNLGLSFDKPGLAWVLVQLWWQHPLLSLHLTAFPTLGVQWWLQLLVQVVGVCGDEHAFEPLFFAKLSYSSFYHLILSSFFPVQELSCLSFVTCSCSCCSWNFGD